jgi:hypothetical protein
MDQRTDATTEDPHHTVHETGKRGENGGSLRAHLRSLAAAGCKRFRPLKCPPGDGRCFNCQAADFIAKSDKGSPEAARRDQIIASLKTDLIAAAARHVKDTSLMLAAADDAGGGRAYAEFRLAHVADLALDLVGALLEADATLERIESGFVADEITEDDARGMCVALQTIAREARERV